MVWCMCVYILCIYNYYTTLVQLDLTNIILHKHPQHHNEIHIYLKDKMIDKKIFNFSFYIFFTKLAKLLQNYISNIKLI